MGGKKRLIIAIDGPAASGKSTTAKMVAKELGYRYVDTGAMYRAVTLKALEENVNLNDKKAVAQIAEQAQIELVETNGEIKTLLDGRDVSREIRSPQIDANINSVCEIPDVRRVMIKLQRKMAEKGGAVVEGRDIGTVVFPQADLKFFLVASLKERAKRRLKELQSMGSNPDIMEIEQEIRRRDELDSHREHSPLKRAKDAILIDTTSMSVQEQVQAILTRIRKTEH